jgi:hypothetical protein
MQRGVLELALVASLAGPAAAQPSSQPAIPAKWLIHDASDRCVATHEYKVDGQDWIVGLEPKPTSDQTSLFLLAPSGASDLRQAHVRIGDVPVASGMQLDVNDPSGRRLYKVSLTNAELARLSANGALQIDDQGHTTRSCSPTSEESSSTSPGACRRCCPIGGCQPTSSQPSQRFRQWIATRPAISGRKTAPASAFALA